MRRAVAIGGVVGLVGIAALAFSGSASAAPKRPPWTTPVPLPGQDGPSWEHIDQAICGCLDHDQAMPALDVVTCTWRAVYPHVPETAEAGDHPTLAHAMAMVATHVEQRLAERKAGTWACGPMPADVVAPINPAANPVAPYLAHEPKALSFYIVAKGDDPTHVARRLWGLGPGHPAVVDTVRAIARSGYNLCLYSERASPGPYNPRVAVRSYSVAPAYLPRNDDAASKLAAGHFPRRTVSATGSRLSGFDAATHYGVLWIPHLERSGESVTVGGTGVQPDSLSPFDAGLLPPAKVLTTLGISPEYLAAHWGEPVQ